MHLLCRFETTRQCAYEQRYHRKLRGRFDRALKGTEADRHDDPVANFTFSELMPFQNEYDAGDELHLVVASPDERVLQIIAKDLQRTPECNVGSMTLTTRAATPIKRDVGEPGSTGWLTTASGALITVERGAAATTADRDFWTEREHDEARYRDAFRESAMHSAGQVGVDPLSNDEPLFADWKHNKTYAVEIDVTPRQSLTVIPSKWDYRYKVQSEQHRRVLNALLATGVGWKRAYGFGCLQPRRDEFKHRDVNGAGVRADG